MSFILHTAIALVIVDKLPASPLIILLLAFLSHWILDFLPHYDRPGMPKKQVIILGIGDLFLSATLLTLYIFLISESSIFLVIGAFLLAIFPDFFLIIDILWNKKLLKPIFHDFHLKMQHEYTWAWIIELIILITVCIILFI